MNLTVSQYLDELEDGSVFTVRDVCSNTDSGYDSVKSQLCRACSSGKISRVHQGIYHKLRYSEILEDYVPCSAEEVACAIARNNGWHFIPSGNTCLNNLGLSTQVPSKLVYYSDGPYRKYEINGIRVEFKHRSPRNLPHDRDLAIIVAAVDAWGKTNCDDKFSRSLSKVLLERGVEYFEEGLDGVTSWVADVIWRALEWRTSTH